MSRRYQFDAYAAYQSLRERYAAFLFEHFGIHRGPLREMLLHHWTTPGTDTFRLFAPLIVQGAFPFQPGGPIETIGAPSAHERSVERPLHPMTLELLKKAGMSWPLFRHQIDTIRAASTGQTVILSTGTGSGKTEAFLIPLIDRLFWDDEERRDDLACPGIRAIIVYPLNALVNNQVERLRKILNEQDRLTFGFYTSRLKDTERSAESYLKKIGKTYGQIELIDRQTLRGLNINRHSRTGPPHILVTNYSMLEYMLIRPLDRTLFLWDHLFHREGLPRLKAIVLDEAHVYAGALAAEIHMLLRRTAKRFGTRLEDLQGYATSATLSQGETNEEKADPLEAFAEKMFLKSAGQTAVIRGEPHLPDPCSPPRAVGPLTQPEALPQCDLVPRGLYTLEFDAESNPKRLVEDPSLAKMAEQACLTLGIATNAEIQALQIRGPEITNCPARQLYHLIASHPRLLALRDWLFNQEKTLLPTLGGVALQLYSDDGESACRATDAVLRLASLARLEARDLPFIPVRMHAFVRSPLGVWVDPRRDRTTQRIPKGWPWGELRSAPPEPDDPTPLLELFLCPTCGAPYLEAWLDDNGGAVMRGTPNQARVMLCAPYSYPMRWALPGFARYRLTGRNGTRSSSTLASSAERGTWRYVVSN